MGSILGPETSEHSVFLRFFLQTFMNSRDSMKINKNPTENYNFQWFRGLNSTPRRPQIGPKSASGGSWGPRNGPRPPGTPPKTLPGPRGTPPGPPQDPPGPPQEGPKALPGPPRTPPRTPRDPREPPGRPPGAPRDAPGSPPGALRDPPGLPRSPQDHPQTSGTPRDPSKIADLGRPKLQMFNGFGGRFGQESGPPREPPRSPKLLVWVPRNCK